MMRAHEWSRTIRNNVTVKYHNKFNLHKEHFDVAPLVTLHFMVERIFDHCRAISEAPFSLLGPGRDIAFRSNETKWSRVMDPAGSWTDPRDDVLRICGTKFRRKYHGATAASRLLWREISLKIIHHSQIDSYSEIYSRTSSRCWHASPIW